MLNSMGVYHITLHAYRSWGADHPKGYVQRGEWGIKPTNVQLAQHRNRIAGQEPTRFTPDMQRAAIEMVKDFCRRRGYVLHGVSVTPTHVHVVLSWEDEQDPKQAAIRLKQLLGMRLGEVTGRRGWKWFSRGQDVKPVEDRKHLDYLIDEYLPEHIHEQGVVWTEKKDGLL
jgi:REP element-mobilizing transposase RayT